jgi:hypothetical protein
VFLVGAKIQASDRRVQGGEAIPHADQLVFTMPGGGVMRLSNWRRSVFLAGSTR